jgi:hypothetical protein
MTIFCQGCHKEHEHFSWKLRSFEDPEGHKQSGWFCGRFFTPTSHKWVPDRIKEERKVHFKDTLQPWRDGEPSREYIQQYPEQAKKTFTEKQLKTARNVWSEATPK